MGLKMAADGLFIAKKLDNQWLENFVAKRPLLLKMKGRTVKKL